ncbi:hypothetical protein HWV62_28589 [Athelia sp. TMB]|nr:hypothetical protein HWV62_28589 [Athelia sp. TMB]
MSYTEAIGMILEKEEHIYRWLAAPDTSGNYNAAREKHHATTGAWLIEGEQFVRWKETPGSALWIYGTRKLDAILSGKTLTNWFAQRDVAKRSSEQSLHHKMLRSIIRQLSHQAGSVPAALVKMYGGGHEQPTLKSLQLTLRHIIEIFEHTYIVIDALDECVDRPKLVAWIEQILRERSSRLHLLLSSRWEQDILNQFDAIPSFPRILLSGKAATKDIESYVDAMLCKVIKWTAEIRARVKQALMNGADGMFRWVAFQIAELMKCRNPLDVDVQLRELPKDLSEIAEVVTIDFSASNDLPTYNADLRYFSPTDVLVFCTGFVTFLPAGKDCPSENINDLESDRSEKLRHLQGTVKLAHMSVKDYLVSERIQHGAASTFSVNEALAHSKIAATCLSYLLRLGDLLLVGESALQSFPLARYAASHCILHVKLGQEDKFPVWPLLTRIFSPGSNALANWVRLEDADVKDSWDRTHYTQRTEDIAPPLYYASSYGLEQLVLELLTTGEDVQARGGAHGNALQAASHHGHSGVARILLEHGAQVNALGKGRAALYTASLCGHPDVVQLLLEHGAAINAIGQGETALRAASRKGHIDIAQLLLQHGADVNESLQGRTALQAASRGGHTDIVRLLLEHGADVNAPEEAETALQAASWGGHTDVVRSLLEHGVDVNALGEGGTALQAASLVSRTDIVRLLLEHGADVNAPGEYGTALNAASHCEYGCTLVMRLLLEHGAQFDAPGENEQALQYACELKLFNCGWNYIA